MIEVYKLTNEHYDQDVTLKLPVTEGRTRGTNKKLYKERCRTKMRQGQFSVRVVEPWNSLPDPVVNAPSVKSFERRLDRFWADQALCFDHTELLRTTSKSQNNISTVYDSDDLDIEVN